MLLLIIETLSSKNPNALAYLKKKLHFDQKETPGEDDVDANQGIIDC
jgi:hypothetical protein